MSSEPTDVMIGAYLDAASAKADYQAVIDSGAKIEGAVRVSRDHVGKLAVEETDHMAKKGAPSSADEVVSLDCQRRTRAIHVNSSAIG